MEKGALQRIIRQHLSDIPSPERLLTLERHWNTDREKYCRLQSLVPHTHTHTHSLVLCQNIISYFTPSFFCWLRLSTLSLSLSLSCWKTHCSWWRRSTRRCVNSTLTPSWRQPNRPSTKNAWWAGSTENTELLPCAVCLCIGIWNFIKMSFCMFSLLTPTIYDLQNSLTCLKVHCSNLVLHSCTIGGLAGKHILQKCSKLVQQKPKYAEF